MAPREFTLTTFATHVTQMIVTYDEVVHHALDHGARIIRDEARRVLGTYDYGWPPLAPSTIARKARGDTPLLETGQMRDSIEYNVTTHPAEAYIGSNLDRAVYHEMGTSRIPPRPFLSSAAAHMETEVAEVMGRHVVTNVFMPRP